MLSDDSSGGLMSTSRLATFEHAKSKKKIIIITPTNLPPKKSEFNLKRAYVANLLP